MRHALLVLLITTCSFCSAQNLVPNPSFEDTVMCPFMGAQVAYARHWYIAEETPDYFNECCVSSQISVPSNYFDFQYAATGFAYCGFYSYSTIDTGYREKIGVELSTPLTIGVKYFVSFKLNSTSRAWNGASNKIGVLFSTMAYTNNLPSPTNDFCQMWTDSIITDTINWTQISGSFVADSEYTNLTIGNFFTNAHTDTIRFRPNPQGAAVSLSSYYFIDDICVSEDSALCIDNPVGIKALEARKRELAVYPNPANSYLSIVTEAETEGFLELYNAEGYVFLRQNIPRGHLEFYEDVAKIRNGIYFIKFSTNDKSISQKIIIHH